MAAMTSLELTRTLTAPPKRVWHAQGWNDCLDRLPDWMGAVARGEQPR